MTYLFGCHPSSEGGVHLAVKRGARAGARALQIFSALPQFYNDKILVKPERVERFNKAVTESGFEKGNIIVHAAYVLNTASPEPEKYARSRTGLAKELERCTQLGVFGFCFHPGSAGSSDPAGAIARVGDAITAALEAVPGASRVLVENTAGAGRTMGRTAEEIAGMLAQVPSGLRARTGYGLDTCHLFSSGHDIRKSRESLTDILDRFVSVTGEGPSFFHLNDSETELGSNRDRHALIGQGQIGSEPFRWLLESPRAQGVPLICETPQGVEPAADDESPDVNDVEMIRLLQSFVA